MLRLQITKAPHRLNIPGHLVETGEPVLGLHLWNEHVPPIPPDGPNVAWAKKVQRAFVNSLQAAAKYIASNSTLSDRRAVGGATILLYAGVHTGGIKLMKRLGFTVMPYQNRLGRYGEFWENFYSWLLVWAYNPGGLHSRNFKLFRRGEIWMATDAFINQYSRDSEPAPE